MGSNALAGVNATVIARTVTKAGLDTALTATEVAITVTLQSLDGGVAGAVYVAGTPPTVLDGEMVPQSGEQATPF